MKIFIEKPGFTENGFTVLELITAIAMLVAVTTLFSGSLRGIRELEELYRAETEAIVVMNNVLERLEAAGGWRSDLAGRMLEDEFEKSRLSNLEGFTPKVRESAEGAELFIMRGKGKTLTSIRLSK
jgi:type II secretory pathway pseudopilin PulG